ncbi:hypothetical protein Tco_0834319 [Tanacetum coccineum]
MHIAENRIVHTFKLILFDVHCMLEMCMFDVARKVVMGMWFHRIVEMCMCDVARKVMMAMYLHPTDVYLSDVGTDYHSGADSDVLSKSLWLMKSAILLETTDRSALSTSSYFAALIDLGDR